MIAHFLAMGGYARYVWPAYGITALGIGGVIILTLRAYARAKTRISAVESGLM